MLSRPAGYALALLAVAFWGGNFVVARAAADSLDPIFLSFLRWLVACALLAPFTLAPVWRARKRLIPHWRGILSASIYGISLFNTFVYLGGKHADAADLAMVAAASPVFIILFAAVVLREKIGRRAVAGIALATCGVLLTTRAAGGGFNPVGTLWALAGAAAFAAYSVGFRKLADRQLPFLPPPQRLLFHRHNFARPPLSFSRLGNRVAATFMEKRRPGGLSRRLRVPGLFFRVEPRPLPHRRHPLRICLLPRPRFRRDSGVVDSGRRAVAHVLGGDGDDFDRRFPFRLRTAKIALPDIFLRKKTRN